MAEAAACGRSSTGCRRRRRPARAATSSARAPGTRRPRRPGSTPLAQQLEDARGGQLDLGALAARRVERDRRRRGSTGAGGASSKRSALELVERRRASRPRSGRRAAAARARSAPSASSSWCMPATALNASAPGLVRERDRHVGPAPVGERLERVELELREVVEPVDEQGRARPRPRGSLAERVERRARRTAPGRPGRRPRGRRGSAR